MQQICDDLLLKLQIGLSYRTMLATQQFVRNRRVLGQDVLGLTALAALRLTEETPSLRPLQKTILLLSAQWLTDSLPIFKEPTGHLILPAYLLYLQVAATLSWLVASLSTTLGGEFTTYLILLTTTRCVQECIDSGQTTPLAYAALCYLLLADHLLPLQAHLKQFTDSLACRAITRTQLQNAPRPAFLFVSALGTLLGCLNDRLPLSELFTTLYAYTAAQQALQELQQQQGYYLVLPITLCLLFLAPLCNKWLQQLIIIAASMQLNTTSQQFVESVAHRELDRLLIMVASLYILYPLTARKKEEEVVHEIAVQQQHHHQQV